MFRRAGVPLLGIVENMSYFCGSSREPILIFGNDDGEQLATELKAQSLGKVKQTFCRLPTSSPVWHTAGINLQ
jgi:Mrp family chromosome partitioning ATPase